jgi:NADPH-ferrihemoprotein reductase
VFGSETGKAEGFAKELCAEARLRGADAQVHSFARWRATPFGSSALDMAAAGEASPQLQDCVMVLLVSTHGEGDPPIDARDFCAALKAGSVELEMPFCVFGLGNRAYQHFNAVAKRVDRRLARCERARRVLPLALGDDGGNLRSDFEVWQAALWNALDLPRAGHAGDDEAHGVEGCTFELVYAAGSSAPAETLTTYPESRACSLLDAIPTATAVVLAVGAPADELHACVPRIDARVGSDAAAPALPAALASSAASERLCVRLSLPREMAAGLDVGDHLGIWAHNSPVLVARLATRLRLRLSAVATLRAPRQRAPERGAAGALGGADRGADDELRASEFDYRFECPCSVREMLTRFLDVQAPLSPPVLRLLAHSCERSREGCAEQRAALLELARGGGGGGRAYSEWVESGNAGLAETLAAFPAAQPDCARLFALLPRLLPRFYSLASDPRPLDSAPCGEAEAAGRTGGSEPAFAGHSVAVTVLATLQRLPGRGVLGVCSAHLARCRPSRDSLRVFGQPSRFKPPRDSRTPLILVAAGSGLAPFLGFLERRARIAAAGGALGAARLYLGVRAEAEVPFRAQLDAWHAEGAVLSEMAFAFSRVQPPERAQRVQALLHADGAALAELLLARQASIYVCGSGAMAASVREALCALLAAYGSVTSSTGLGRLDERAAQVFVVELQKSGRFQQDVWG